MRLLFMDESGTSANDPVIVVAGVLIRPDDHWRQLDTYLKEVAKKHIPDEHLDGFVFHAKEISAGKGIFSDKDKWPPDKRWNIIKDVLYANKEIGYDICLGVKRQAAGADKKGKKANGLRLLDHLMAFSECLLAAEWLLRSLPSPEIATVVAEDIPERKSYLRKQQKYLQGSELDCYKYTNLVPLRHIVQSPLFAAKDESTHLQYADACAFAVRGYYAGFRGFDELVSAMTISGTADHMPKLHQMYRTTITKFSIPSDLSHPVAAG